MHRAHPAYPQPGAAAPRTWLAVLLDHRGYGSLSDLASLTRSCPYRKLHPEWLAAAGRVICCGMIDGLKLLACMVVSLFRSKGRLEAEIVILRHQLNILRRRKPSGKRLTLVDRLIFVWLYRLAFSVGGA